MIYDEEFENLQKQLNKNLNFLQECEEFSFLLDINKKLFDLTKNLYMEIESLNENQRILQAHLVELRQELYDTNCIANT